MTTKIGIFTIACAVFSSVNAQLDNFTTTLNSFFSVPEENGFMFFNIPNNYPVGACFQYYKGANSDTDNDMILIKQYHDAILNMDHYKFQQVYKNIIVEGAGCIEHYDNNGSLVFTNAKHAVNIDLDVIPKITQDMALDIFLTKVDPNLNFAWLNPTLEQNLKIDLGNPDATYLPIPKLILALDNYQNLTFNIDGSRFRLAYQITAQTENPTTIITYFMDANTGEIFKSIDELHNDGPAFVQNYYIQTIDSRWRGGVYQDFILHTNDNGRDIHTKKKDNDNINITWWTTSNTTDDNDQWPQAKYVETSAHFFATKSWDYFKTAFNWEGMDSYGSKVRVRTHLQQDNAFFHLVSGSSIGMMDFGSTPVFGDHYSTEPSVVGHEFTHGITKFTADLINSDESGALNESFSDIFGVMIQAKMLDGNFTDWIIGNNVQGGHLRSLIDPKSEGEVLDGNGSIVWPGQPDTYQGINWITSTFDNGGVHINSGVQNKWFQLLSSGGTGINDNGNSYNLQGIGIDKSSKIAFVALTNFLMNSSQYVDSRMATITAAQLLYGECSFEYQSTKNAWYAVGVGPEDNCNYTLNIDAITNNIDRFNIFPNPSNNIVNITTPTINENFTINIFDISGKKIRTINPDDYQFTIDISNLESGVYIVNYDTDELKLNKKLVVK
ncbi:MAG: M4 family metallopeptidase [Crocinitomicaceae bacterium]